MCRLWATGKIPYSLYVYIIIFWVINPSIMFEKVGLE